MAIVLGQKGGHDIGVGAILGAPFMLTTLAMFVLGMSVLIFARGDRRPARVIGDRRVILQDLGYFLVMYALALVAGLIHQRAFRWGLAGVLMIGYAVYVWRHFQVAGDPEEKEAVGEVRPLYLRSLMRKLNGRPAGGAGPPPLWGTSVQVGVALTGIILGAKVFVSGITRVADTFGLPKLVLALLLAPFATELPEKFNSVIWVRRRKDTLAMGNLTGAMVFQSSFPVTVGLLLTSWRLNQEAAVAAVIALLAGSVLWITVKVKGELDGRLLLLQGVFYAVYVGYVITRL